MKKSPRRLIVLAVFVLALAALALWGFSGNSAETLTDGFSWDKVTRISLGVSMNRGGQACSAVLNCGPGEAGFEDCVSVLSKLTGRRFASRSDKGSGFAFTAVVTYDDPSRPEGWNLLAISGGRRALNIGGAALGMDENTSKALRQYLTSLPA